MNGVNLEDPECLFQMGRCFCYGWGVAKNESRQFQYFMKAANVGHAGEKRLLRWGLETGKGTEVDMVQSVKYYKAAAEAGDHVGFYNYGNYMLNGRGVKSNVKVGVELLQIAVNAGSMVALKYLSDCYRIGKDIEQDHEKAFRLFNQAATAVENNLDALTPVAECLIRGYGVSKNETKGVGTVETQKFRITFAAFALLRVDAGLGVYEKAMRQITL